MSYTRKQCLKYNNIYYYCSYHRAIKLSGLFTKNNYKKKLSLCNTKILYKKDEGEYYQ